MEPDMGIDATDEKQTHLFGAGDERALPVWDSNRATSSTANSGSGRFSPPETSDASSGSSVSLPTTLTVIPADSMSCKILGAPSGRAAISNDPDASIPSGSM